jgi:alpha/beta superfamily hydrolase
MKTHRMLAATTIAAGLASAAAWAAPHSAEIQAPGPAGPLAGMLLTAEAPDAPVVLIIPGSGPTDRDGNNPLGVAASTYRLLAEALATKGVTTARIDKRGMFGSKAAIADPNKVTIGDYAADVASWVKMLKERSGRPCIWVAGHSEGGLVALAAAQPKARLVLVEGMNHTLKQVVGDGPAANIATYTNPALPIDPEAVEAIATFVRPPN